VVLVSRDHEDDVARYGIDVHEIVLRRHEFFCQRAGWWLF
jgi:hypothetical protein